MARHVDGSELAAYVHLYRGELSRSDTWRTRLDTTTNWALTTSAATLSFTFSSPEAPHAILLVGIYLVASFLVIEARRYRYYDLWIRRVRLLEAGIYAPLLRGEPLDEEALRELTAHIARPRLEVSAFDALAQRLRRTYAGIFGLLVLCWVIKIAIHPARAHSARAVLANAHVGPVPGGLVAGFVGLGGAALAALVLWSFIAPLPQGELRARRGRRGPLREVLTRGAR